jgi:hypothetical protein
MGWGKDKWCLEIAPSIHGAFFGLDRRSLYGREFFGFLVFLTSLTLMEGHFKKLIREKSACKGRRCGLDFRSL